MAGRSSPRNWNSSGPLFFLCQLWFLSQSFSCFLCFFYWFLLLNLKLMLSFLFGGWGQEYEKNIKLQVGVGWSVESRGTGSMVCWESTGTSRFGNYSFSHNHGSGKLPQMKGNDPIGGTHFPLAWWWEESYIPRTRQVNYVNGRWSENIFAYTISLFVRCSSSRKNINA